jgi:hypothetical protein
MGLAPVEVDAMSIWEFVTVSASYRQVHGGKGGGDAPAMSDDRAAQLGIEGF